MVPQVTLRAVYAAPQLDRTFEHTLTAPVPTPPHENAKVKVAYLAELRNLVPTLQNDINVFLTAQMEEDKKAAEAQGRSLLSAQEAKEEANYGEEVVEEEE
ncbi:hypothetical protein ARAM_006811 [Aspergillus rambellii]|uniref:EKC/KEOPS complex subunit GON7 n=2 Tax=Aspergillus subgen. Nidulantes TaxID=2720870 RepID=A0A0F8VD72_9EURO|nr:hypothetical protein AOCH_004937 [Aspergillus ochraceoroseus]KKK21041.1 hypothetical protein ARAM_006811 [Aspergillus rambellii]